MSATTATRVDPPVHVMVPEPSVSAATQGAQRAAPQPPSRKGSPHGLTHGLTSRQAVVAGETAAALDAYRTDLLAVLQPGDALEDDLAEGMIMAQWKLRRLWRQETGVYAHWQKQWEHPDLHGTFAFLRDCNAEQAFTRLTRHEAHFMRAYLRAEARLRLLQDLRRKGLRAVVARSEERVQAARTDGAPGTESARVDRAGSPPQGVKASGEPAPPAVEPQFLPTPLSSVPAVQAAPSSLEGRRSGCRDQEGGAAAATDRFDGGIPEIANRGRQTALGKVAAD